PRRPLCSWTTQLPRRFWPSRKSEASDPPDRNFSPWRMARLLEFRNRSWAESPFGETDHKDATCAPMCSRSQHCGFSVEGSDRRRSCDRSRRRGAKALVQPEFAVDCLDLGRLDQPRVRDGHRVQGAFQGFEPEGEEAVERRKARAEVVVLPD